MYERLSMIGVFGSIAVAIGLTCDVVAQQNPSEATARKVDAAASTPVELPDDIQGLLEHVKGVHGYRTDKPKTPSKIVRNYRSVEAALEKIHAIATDGDKQLPAYQDAMDLRLVFRTIAFSEGPRRGTPQERAELIEEIIARLGTSPNPSKDAMAAARKVAGALDFSGDPQAAAQYNRRVARILMSKSSKEAADLGDHLLAAARRLDSVGKPLELTGTLMDGGPIDWASYRGKVVLIEIWATWCTPCIHELNHVEQLYEQYHPRGFEVVGISVDENRQVLEGFLEKHPLPWATLNDGGPADNPFTTRYGITGASAAILVGRDGSVVNIRARDKQLDRLLEELLGPPSGATREK